MADLGDVTALLATMAGAACYPNGLTSASVAGDFVTIRIFEGWPIAAQLDADIAAGACNVSIFPQPNATANVFQVQNEPYVVTPPVYGMGVTISGTSITVTGTPGAGEFLTIIADGKYSYSRLGNSVAAILAAIQTDALANYASVLVVGNTITFTTSRLVAHIGAPATAAQATHRQKDQILISVWAPSPTMRNVVAAAIDVAFKAVNRITFPDTSSGNLVYIRNAQLDNHERAAIYRRDLVYSVEYATLQTFTVWPITSFNPTLDGGPSEYGSAALETFAQG